jgi:hypothetical protein
MLGKKNILEKSILWLEKEPLPGQLAGTDESLFVYRKLQEVLDTHEGTIEVIHELKRIGIVMTSD